MIRCKDPVSSLATPPTTPTSTGFDSSLPSLESFIKIVVRKSKCHVPTLLCTLVYLDRLKFRLPARSRGSPTTRHRVFLSALIVAAKYLNGKCSFAVARALEVTLAVGGPLVVFAELWLILASRPQIRRRRTSTGRSTLCTSVSKRLRLWNASYSPSSTLTSASTK